MSAEALLIWEQHAQHSVGGIMVSIAAFQAVDPGSIPGRRKTFVASVHLLIYIQELGQYPHGEKNISVTGN